MSEVFAFEWCDCVFESGFSTESLHATMRGAFKAMTAKANEEWLDRRNGALMYGSSSVYPLAHQAWRVRRIEVQP